MNADIEREIRELFKIFDEDNSGDIDKFELIRSFNGLGHEIDVERAEAMIKAVDTDGNGKIDINEFT